MSTHDGQSEQRLAIFTGEFPVQFSAGNHGKQARQHISLLLTG